MSSAQASLARSTDSHSVQICGIVVTSDVLKTSLRIWRSSATIWVSSSMFVSSERGTVSASADRFTSGL